MNMNMNNYYAMLEVPRGASLETIKKARNRLALKWHPDKNLHRPAFASQQMVMINEAFEWLAAVGVNESKAMEEFQQKVQVRVQSAKRRNHGNMRVSVSARMLRDVASFRTAFRKCQEDMNASSDMGRESLCDRMLNVLLESVAPCIHEENADACDWFQQFQFEGGLHLFQMVAREAEKTKCWANHSLRTRLVHRLANVEC